MKTYAEWCQHYDYDPATEAAKADYQRYREQRRVQRQFLSCDFMEYFCAAKP